MQPIGGSLAPLANHDAMHYEVCKLMMEQVFTARFLTRIGMSASVLASLCSGQPGRRLESPANRSLVTIIHVKPEMLTELLDLQKNGVAPALKKAGVKARTVYASGIFARV